MFFFRGPRRLVVGLDPHRGGPVGDRFIANDFGAVHPRVRAALLWWWRRTALPHGGGRVVLPLSSRGSYPVVRPQRLRGRSGQPAAAGGPTLHRRAALRHARCPGGRLHSGAAAALRLRRCGGERPLPLLPVTATHAPGRASAQRPAAAAHAPGGGLQRARHLAERSSVRAMSMWRPMACVPAEARLAGGAPPRRRTEAAGGQSGRIERTERTSYLTLASIARCRAVTMSPRNSWYSSDASACAGRWSRSARA